MRNAIGLSLLPLLAASAAGLSADEPKASWRSLPLIESGRVADGWTFTGFGSFAVEDGVLRTEPDARGLGLLVYEKEKFGDCQVRVVYRTEKPASNAGVYVRIDEGILDAEQPAPAERKPDGSLTDAGLKAMKEASAAHAGPWYAVHHGYEVQICDSADEWHRTGAIYSLAKSEAAPKKPPGEWRTLVITLKGDLILVDLDGTRVTTFDPGSPSLPERKEWHEPEREPPRPRSGYIGLQTHDPGDVVEFKEVSVRPLNEAP